MGVVNRRLWTWMDTLGSSELLDCHYVDTAPYHSGSASGCYEDHDIF